MSETPLMIQSHKGSYPVTFGSPYQGLERELPDNHHLIIDARVAKLHEGMLQEVLASPSVLMIEATEENKSLEKIPQYIQHLIDQGIRRGHTLVAVGGGIIQDIVAFVAAILFRGLSWRFYPTTLLAQADSCIGSKSSINVGGYKNQVGTFTPPEQIHIATEVLETLDEVDFRSGVGEMIKAHWIASARDVEQIKCDYPALSRDKRCLLKTIRRSLEIKKGFIEKDEFDQNERLILNYGHSFGHAIESATQYRIPHGIAITIGMDMASFISKEFGFLAEEQLDGIHPLLKKNYRGFESVAIPFAPFLSALGKDKKNQGEKVSLILTRGPGNVFRGSYSNDQKLQQLCQQYFQILRL